MSGRGALVGLATSKQKGTPKSPVSRCVALRGLGIEADAHAGPGPRQVSILAIESVRRMESQLGEPLGIGRFGENVVVEGLALADARAGDLIACGSRTVLEVTAIGKECHQGCDIRRRTGDCIMPREGVFARVVLGGEMAVGDGVRSLRPARDLTAVVLAGGRSTRFGGDKRRAVLAGADLLSRALSTARAVTPQVVLAVGRGEGGAFSAHAPVVEDADGDVGPLAGIAAAMRAVETAWCVFLPVDTPLLPPDLLRALSALAGDSGAVAADSRGMQPLIACWSRASGRSFEDAAAAGRFAVHEVAERLRPVVLGPRVLAQFGDPTRLFANVNSPQDLAVIPPNEVARLDSERQETGDAEIGETVRVAAGPLAARRRRQEAAR
jgi:molybdopterin-guanine dinucleotide biosynthesis protein A